MEYAPSYSFSVSGWGIPLGLIAFGAVLAVLGVLLLGEYRRVFFADPERTMSVEVFLQLLFHPAATPAYLGVVLLFAAAWFVIIGLFALALLSGAVLQGLWHMWFPPSPS